MAVVTRVEKDARVSRLHIGTSGWSYPHWRGVFYPEDMRQSKWLEFYQGRFSAVEVNYSFYRLPRESTLRKWRDASPAGFRFALKGSRLITHLKRLRDVQDNLELFCDRARILGEHLGPVLWQLPPDMEKDIGVLADFLSRLPADLEHAVEFRNPGWYGEDTFQLLRNSGPVAFCIHDKHGSESPSITTASLVYVRFHGPAGNYQGNYGPEQLQAWANRISEHVLGGSEVWAFFNNDIGGCAVRDALALESLVTTLTR